MALAYVTTGGLHCRTRLLFLVCSCPRCPWSFPTQSFSNWTPTECSCLSVVECCLHSKFQRSRRLWHQGSGPSFWLCYKHKSATKKEGQLRFTHMQNSIVWVSFKHILPCTWLCPLASAVFLEDQSGQRLGHTLQGSMFITGRKQDCARKCVDWSL